MTEVAPRFAIVSSPLPSAISVVRLWGEVDDLFDRPLPRSESRHRHVRMVDVDEGVVSRSHDGSLLFTPHGGAGVLDALRERMKQLGVVEQEAPEVDTDFARDMSLYQRKALAMLPHATSDGQLGVLLDALEYEFTEEFDLSVFAESWNSVERWLSTPRVVLSGAPNVGKSTLFNALTQGPQAIVSQVPGTTRDYLHAQWLLPNQAVVELIDTAGLRDDVSSEVEALGIEKSRELVASADCVLELYECGERVPQSLDDANHLRIATKCDQGEAPTWADVSLSVERGAGLDELAKRLSDHLFPPLPQAPLALDDEMANDARRWLESPKAFVEKWFATSENS